MYVLAFSRNAYMCGCMCACHANYGGMVNESVRVGCGVCQMCAQSCALNFYIDAKTRASVDTATKEKTAVKVVTPQPPAKVSAVSQGKKEEPVSKPTTQAATPTKENGETSEVVDFDMPLIVHVDDSLNELDDDIVKKKQVKGVAASGQGDVKQGAASTTGTAATPGKGDDATATTAEAKNKDGKTDKEDAKKTAEVVKGDGAKQNQQEAKRLVCMNDPLLRSAAIRFNRLGMFSAFITSAASTIQQSRSTIPNVIELMLLPIMFCLLPILFRPSFVKKI